MVGTYLPTYLPFGWMTSGWTGWVTCGWMNSGWTVFGHLWMNSGWTGLVTCG
jgi:hypothetical protein